MHITPTPSPEEAAAIAAAVQVLLQANRHGGADPLPAAYRSAWRNTAIREGVGLASDNRRTR
jgi:hypothetical protein